MEVANKIQILPLRRPAAPANGRLQSPEDDDKPAKKPSKKTRTGKPKVRTGCLTCKIRRVKCDESKPSCNRCLSTGRKCDGYFIPPRKNQADASSQASSQHSSSGTATPERGLALAHASPMELQALGFFHSCTAPGLSLFFDSDFWTRLVLQMSFAEPAIKHAMIAVGSLHKQRESVGRSKTVPTLRVAYGTVQTHQNIMGVEPARSVESSLPMAVMDTAHNDPFALTHYNKAISHLSTHIQQSDASVEVALLACILFVCVEFLRGDVEPALKHFQSGMNIAIATLSRTGSRFALASVQRLRDNMLPFFNRLEILSTLFGNDAPWEYPVDILETVPTIFTSMTEARNSITHLMNIGLRFIRSVKFRRHEPTLPEDLARQTVLLRQLDSWASTFDLLLLSGTLSKKDLSAAKLMRVHQHITHIWLKTSTHDDESSDDEHMVKWETTLNLAEAFLADAGTPGEGQYGSSTFLFDMEIVSPLYFVAIKCRHPQIRRRTIALLRHMARRENLWDSSMAAAVAERIMTLEEINMTKFDGSELPQEKDRVMNAHIQSTIGLHPDLHSVTFFMRPDGLDGDWKTWTETIVLD